MSTEYGNRLAQARKKAKLTQVQLAAKTGIPQSTISTAEREGLGSKETPVYAHALEVDALWLATGEGQMELPSNQSKSQGEIARDAIKGVATLEQITEALAGYLMQMDEDGRDDAGDILRKLAHKPEGHARTAAMLHAAFHSGKRKVA